MPEPDVILTTDAVCFTLLAGRLHVLLMQRTEQPFKGKLALPGGYIHTEDDDTEFAARRIAKDKVGLRIAYLEQLQTFSGKDRDPRGWSASVVYLAMIQQSRVPEEHREFYPITDAALHGLPELAFDHNKMVSAALERLRSKSSYSSLPLFFMPAKFTLTELQQVYEETLGTTLNVSRFRRRVIEQGIVEATGEWGVVNPQHRPAELYRRTARTLRLFEREI